jgi:hypothetical protein
MFFGRYGGAMRPDDREPEGEKGVKTEIRWVRVDRTCIFSVSASRLNNSSRSCCSS